MRWGRNAVSVMAEMAECVLGSEIWRRDGEGILYAQWLDGRFMYTKSVDGGSVYARLVDGNHEVKYQAFPSIL